MTGVLLKRGNLDTGADHQSGLMKSRESRNRWPFSRQGIPKVPEARREPSPENSEGEKPCWHFNLQLLASISVRQCNSAVLSSLICGPVLQEREEPNGDLPDPGMEPRLLALQADSLLSEPPGKSRKLQHVLYAWAQSSAPCLEAPANLLRQASLGFTTEVPQNTAACSSHSFRDTSLYRKPPGN